MFVQPVLIIAPHRLGSDLKLSWLGVRLSISLPLVQTPEVVDVYVRLCTLHLA